MLSLTRGAGDRFARLRTQCRLAPEQTAIDLFLGTVQRSCRARLVVLARDQKPRIDLNLVERLQP